MRLVRPILPYLIICFLIISAFSASQYIFKDRLWYEVSPKFHTQLHSLQARAIEDRRIFIDTPTRVYDVFLIGNKYYNYWGIGTAALLLPFYAANQYFTENALCLALLLLCGPLWFLILKELYLTGFMKRVSTKQQVFLAVYAVLGTLLFNLATQPLSSYVTLVVVFSLVSLSILFWLRSSFNLHYFIHSNLFFAIACLCRSDLFLIAPVYAAFTFHYLQRFGNQRPRKAIFVLGCFFYLAAAGVQLYFNQLKWGSPFSFGIELSGRYKDHDVNNIGVYSVTYFLKNLKIYLLDPVTYSLSKPFIHYAKEGNAIWSYQFGVWVVFIAFFAGRKFTNTQTAAKLIYPTLLWLLGFTVLLFCCFTGYVNFGGRYLVAVLPFLLMVLFVAYSLTSGWTRYLATILFSASILVQLIVDKPFM